MSNSNSYLTPMLLLTGASAVNEWYNSGKPLDAVKPLVMGGIATGILAVFSNIPEFGQVATGIAWVAFVALMISPVQKPSPVDNLTKILGGS